MSLSTPALHLIQLAMYICRKVGTPTVDVDKLFNCCSP